jgi:hypothetical protein
VRKSHLLFASLVLCAAFVGCTKSTPPAGTSAAVHKHEHKTPHGGTPIVLGNEVYHIELVREAAEGKMTAYVLDSEMENFIRVKAPSFEIIANVGGEKRTLAFKAVANTATGETIGDTAQFETQADWLKTSATFDALITAIEIRGSHFAAVAFNFPKGNDKD